MSKIKGKNILTFLRLNSSDEWNYMGLQTSCEINISRSTLEYSGKTTGQWRNYKGKRLGWSISDGHLLQEANAVNYTYLDLITADSIEIALVSIPDDDKSFTSVVSTTADSRFAYYGNCLITSYTVQASSEGYTQINLSIQGTGELKDGLPESMQNRTLYLIKTADDEYTLSADDEFLGTLNQ